MSTTPPPPAGPPPPVPDAKTVYRDQLIQEYEKAHRELAKVRQQMADLDRRRCVHEGDIKIILQLLSEL